MKDLLGILVTVSANVINPVILVSIWTINIKKKCKKRLVNKLVELSSAKECTENIEKKKAKITLPKNENKQKCSFCRLYIVLFSIFFTINVGFGSYFLNLQ